MFMPKTSVYKNYSTVLGKNNIRAAGQAANIFTVAKTLREQKLPHDFLRFIIFAPDM